MFDDDTRASFARTADEMPADVWDPYLYDALFDLNRIIGRFVSEKGDAISEEELLAMAFASCEISRDASIRCVPYARIRLDHLESVHRKSHVAEQLVRAHLAELPTVGAEVRAKIAKYLENMSKRVEELGNRVEAKRREKLPRPVPA